jgi:hypothetical protein
MIRADQIPDEVVEAAAWAACDDINGEGAWDEMPFRHKPMWRSAARASIAAALNAWPALEICYFLPQGRTITLPFPNVSKYPRKEGDK